MSGYNGGSRDFCGIACTGAQNGDDQEGEKKIFNTHGVTPNKKNSRIILPDFTRGDGLNLMDGFNDSFQPFVRADESATISKLNNPCRAAHPCNQNITHPG